MECNTEKRRWFEVEKHYWYGWRAEYATNYTLGCIFPFFTNIEFNTHEEAKSFIMDKMPKPKESELPVTRRIYDRIPKTEIK